jgi:hypothetical protein
MNIFKDMKYISKYYSFLRLRLYFNEKYYYNKPLCHCFDTVWLNTLVIYCPEKYE